ncbi:hypothetical protein R3P38DRAFT_3167708 [Favolaschia claudopus]|uniref:Gag-like protein n=1 Tax=Favolaschia claudopus TaxID=2862362 RepID=A0AAW0E430_9AGAR
MSVPAANAECHIARDFFFSVSYSCVRRLVRLRPLLATPSVISLANPCPLPSPSVISCECFLLILSSYPVCTTPTFSVTKNAHSGWGARRHFAFAGRASLWSAAPVWGSGCSLSGVGIPQSRVALAAGCTHEYVSCPVSLAGSVYFLLQSRDKVDLALSRGRICWGCYKYGHTKARCNVKAPSCAVCAKPVGDHSPTTPCSGPVACLNCGGKHRADSYSCPKRKELLVTLAGRMKDLHESLDKSSIHPLPFIQQHAH